MGRRSDHTREELQNLLISHGHAILAETGYGRFSGRAVAKAAGYSVGTIYNVFGSLDLLIAAINTRTFEMWAAHLREALAVAGEDRIAALVRGYFAFAEGHPLLWAAIYEHRLPEGETLPDAYLSRRAALTDIVETEVRRALPSDADTDVGRLARSLVAVVHGHCSFALGGTFALLGETDPVGSALARVRESLSAHGYAMPAG